MVKYIELKYCPRVEIGQLKKAIPHCKFRGRQFPGVPNNREWECMVWTRKGLIKYCKDNNISIEFNLGCVCILDELPDTEQELSAEAGG